jgi:anti-sigma B factor antagonist
MLEPQPALQLKITSKPIEHGYYMVDIDGEVDIATSTQLRDALYEIIAQGHNNLVLNLDQVRYIDTSGLGVLMGARKRVREHEGRILIVCSNPRLQRLFAITSLAKVFDIFDTIDEMQKKIANGLSAA